MENKCIEFHLNVDDNKGSWKQQNIAPETTKKRTNTIYYAHEYLLYLNIYEENHLKITKYSHMKTNWGKNIYEKLCEFFSCFRQIRWRELLYVCI